MTANTMPEHAAIAAIHAARDQRDVVVTTMSTARDWMTLPSHALDIVMVPSAMGHATSMALGLSLAQPDRRVIVCNGDGSMLMNLGSLVSIVDAGATNLIVVVFDNGVYEVTGSQLTPASGAVDFVGIARAAGFHSLFEFDDLDEWRQNVAAILGATGPVFVRLHVATAPGVPGPKSPGPAGRRAQALMDALRQ